MKRMTNNYDNRFSTHLLLLYLTMFPDRVQKGQIFWRILQKLPPYKQHTKGQRRRRQAGEELISLLALPAVAPKVSPDTFINRFASGYLEGQWFLSQWRYPSEKQKTTNKIAELKPWNIKGIKAASSCQEMYFQWYRYKRKLVSYAWRTGADHCMCMPDRIKVLLGRRSLHTPKIALINPRNCESPEENIMVVPLAHQGEQWMWDDVEESIW